MASGQNRPTQGLRPESWSWWRKGLDDVAGEDSRNATSPDCCPPCGNCWGGRPPTSAGPRATVRIG